MLEILGYVGYITGGILLLMLLLSLVGGLDIDFDFDADAGGFGVFKAILTFFSIGSLTTRAFLLTQENPVLGFVVGAAAGAVAVWLLSLFLRLLLRQQSNVNYSSTEALGERGRVYVPIPAGGEGLVMVRVRGTKREMKARSSDQDVVSTGTPVIVEEHPRQRSLSVHRRHRRGREPDARRR